MTPPAMILAGGRATRMNGADKPLLLGGRPLLARLLAARGPLGLALAATRVDGALRAHLTCALWPVGLRGDLAATLARDQRRVRDFTARHQPGLAVWDGGADDPFANINTPEDLFRAEARLAAS